jgi:ABC-type antimicrobial peptide transport system permease subunit
MLALAILLGLGAGAVMTLTAGARRTDSAYGRFAREYLAADILIYPSFDPSFASFDFDQLAALPQVTASARQHYMATREGDLEVIAGDQDLGRTVNRVKILEGRLPRPDSKDEAAVSFSVAKTKHLGIGDTMLVHFGTLDGGAMPYTLRVVGIEAAPNEFPPLFTNSTPGQGGVIRVASPLYESLRDRVFILDFLLLRLRGGSAGFAAMNEKLSELAGDKVQINQNLGAQASNVQRSIHLQAVALRIVGGLVALIGLLMLSQLVARQAALDATDAPTLLALGMTRREIALSGLWRSAMVGATGALIAVVGAFAASPLMPIGTARLAEPDPGFSIDASVLSIGLVGTVLVFIALAALPLWRSTKAARREIASAAKPSLPARSTTLAGLPPSMSTGIRHALETGRGRTAVPVRSSLLSVALAIVALAAALTFGAGLDHLLESPLQYGWNWDGHVTTTADDSAVTGEVAMKALQSDPDVAAAALVDTPPVRIGDVSFDAIALKQQKGDLQPVVLDGRAPRAANEIALGVKTLRDLHAHLGSTVNVSIAAIAGGGARFTVVGTVVIPPNSDTARLGSGGVITYDGELAMVPAGFTNIPAITEVYFRVAPGADKKQVFERLEKVYGGDYEILLPAQPVDLVNFGQVQDLPLLLAGLVAALAAATLVHTLVTSIRRRRRDLAILKMIGFAPTQVRWAVAWQATTFVSAALLIGLPVGIAMGRVIWTAFAHQLGTLANPVTPSLQLLLTIPGAVVLSNVVAAIPAVMAGRMKPAPVLRAE